MARSRRFIDTRWRRKVWIKYFMETWTVCEMCDCIGGTEFFLRRSTIYCIGYSLLKPRKNGNLIK